MGQKSKDQVTSQIESLLGGLQFESALHLAKAAVHTYPEDGELRLLLGVCYQRMSKYADAISEMGQALNLDPENVDAILSLSTVLCDIGQFDEAEDLLGRKKLVLEQKDQKLMKKQIAHLHHRLSRLHRSPGQFHTSLQELQKSKQFDGDNNEVRLEIAELLFESGQIEKSISEIQEILSEDPENAEALEFVGLLYSLQGKHKNASESISKSNSLGFATQTSKFLSKYLARNQPKL